MELNSMYCPLCNVTGNVIVVPFMLILGLLMLSVCNALTGYNKNPPYLRKNTLHNLRLPCLSIY